MVPFPYVLKTIILPYQRFIEHIILNGIHSGEFNRINSIIMASSLLGVMQFSIIKLHFGVKDNTVEEIKDTIKIMFFKSLIKTRT
jgi:hypothetical protein